MHLDDHVIDVDDGLLITPRSGFQSCQTSFPIWGSFHSLDWDLVRFEKPQLVLFERPRQPEVGKVVDGLGGR